MNKFTKKAVAFMSAAIMSTCSVVSLFPAAALDTTEVKVVYDCWSDGITFASKTDPTLFETTVTDKGYAKIPVCKLEKEGYRFQGWTVDGIYGLKAGDIVSFDEGATEVTIKPVWTNDADTVYYSLFYVLDKEEATRPEDLRDRKNTTWANQIIALNETKIEAGEYYSKGWTDGEQDYIPNGMTPLYIVMPDHDLTLTPIWKHISKLSFVTGDVDRIKGMTEFVTSGNEGTHTELSANNRLTRIGFNLTGWLSDYDNKVYEPGQTIIVPEVDVTYTAVWTPRNYVVVFNSGTGNSNDNIKVNSATDETFKVPEMTASKAGYTFGGWKDNSTGTIYQPGDDYTVYGALAGMGISLTAVWNKGEEVPAVTTVPPTTDAGIPTSTTPVTNEGSAAGIPTSTADAGENAGIPTNSHAEQGIATNTQPVPQPTGGIPTSTAAATGIPVTTAPVFTPTGIPVNTAPNTGFPTQTDLPSGKFLKVRTNPTTTNYTSGEMISFSGLVIEYETAIEYSGENMGKIVYKTMPAEFAPDPHNVLIFPKNGDSDTVYTADKPLKEGSFTVKYSGDAEINGVMVKNISFEYDIDVVHVMPPNYGDANLDGEVTLADALAILQYVANSEKYPMSDEAIRNADVYDNGDGVTAMDALTIQQRDAKMITKLPYSFLVDGKQVINK